MCATRQTDQLSVEAMCAAGHTEGIHKEQSVCLTAHVLRQNECDFRILLA